MIVPPTIEELVHVVAPVAPRLLFCTVQVAVAAAEPEKLPLFGLVIVNDVPVAPVGTTIPAGNPVVALTIEDPDERVADDERVIVVPEIDVTVILVGLAPPVMITGQKTTASVSSCPTVSGIVGLPDVTIADNPGPADPDAVMLVTDTLLVGTVRVVLPAPVIEATLASKVKLTGKEHCVTDPVPIVAAEALVIVPAAET
jgi:hypothetical protein